MCDRDARIRYEAAGAIARIASFPCNWPNRISMLNKSIRVIGIEIINRIGRGLKVGQEYGCLRNQRRLLLPY